MSMKAIISGGGIGGLTTATALAQRGWDVTVYESNPVLRVTGSGIYLWTNGLKVLRDIGAYERALRDPFWSLGVENRNQDNEMMTPAFVPPGLDILCVARTDLLAGLEEAARRSGVRIVTHAQVVGARADGSLAFANGDRVRADLVVGCDGAGSPVRRSLGLETSFLRSPEGALRTIVKAKQEDLDPADRGRCFENWNGRRRLLVTPINSEEIYLALTCPERDDEARDPAVLDCWRTDFPHWRFLLDRIDAEVLWNVYAIVKCDTWSAGRACILGDAAHAQPPNFGQGGGMAMQNGMALAAYMANVMDRRDIPDALKAWEAAVRPLTDECQYWSCMWGELVSLPNEERTRLLRSVSSNAWLGGKICGPGMSEPIVRTDWAPAPWPGRRVAA